MKKGFIIVVVVSVLVSCGCRPKNTEPIVWREALTDSENGNVVACWLQYDWQDEQPFVLSDDYAMIVVWEGGVKRFYLFDDINKKYFGTKDFETFLEVIEGLPEGIMVEWLNTCGGPLSLEMPRDKDEQLWAAIKGGHHEFTGEPGLTICTCESKGLKLPWIEGDGQDDVVVRKMAAAH